MMKKCVFAALFAASSLLFAEGHISTQGHQEAVTSFSTVHSGTFADGSYFSAGNDGFLVKWRNDGTGEHFQITNLSIKLIAQNPATEEIAVYETDNAKVHSVSVWDWKSLQRKFVKRFPDTITSLSYTAKGSYIIVGTTAVNGTYFLDSQKGSVVKKIKDNTGIISMAETGASEKNCVMYSPNGYLTYYSMETGSQKARMATEASLFQPCLFANNEFFAGTKDSAVYIIQATTGKKIATFSATNPLLLPSRGEAETGLFFIDREGKTFTLKYIDNIELKESVKNAKTVSLKNIASFSGLSSRDSITSGIKLADRIIPVVGEAEGMASGTNRQSGKIMLGTKSGNLFEVEAIASSATQNARRVTSKAYQKILDAVADGNDFYFLTADSVYRTAYIENAVPTAYKVAQNNGSTNLIRYGNSVILWTKDSRRAVVMANVETGEQTPIFTPTSPIQVMKLFGERLVYIQGSASVRSRSLITGEDKEIYTGTAVQDAVLFNDRELYVAKSIGSDEAGLSPLIHVDTTTFETVSVQAKGSIAYSLSSDTESKEKSFFGISVQQTAGSETTKTTVFSYKPVSKTFSPVLQFSDEDPEAFTALYQNFLYTNIGKSQVRSFNTQTKKTLLFKRSASMPLKVARSPEMLLILNRDGSFSWYKPTFAAVVSDWYLSDDGEWQVFN